MMNDESKVSVVMLSFNRKNDVAEGIGELLAQDHKNLEIIIVDNGSSDGTAEMVTEKFPPGTSEIDCPAAEYRPWPLMKNQTKTPGQRNHQKFKTHL